MNDRNSPEGIQAAVALGGRMTRETLDRLLALLPQKTAYEFWVTLEVQTPTMLKVIDNEADALETIDRLERAPAKTDTTFTARIHNRARPPE